MSRYQGKYSPFKPDDAPSDVPDMENTDAFSSPSATAVPDTPDITDELDEISSLCGLNDRDDIPNLNSFEIPSFEEAESSRAERIARYEARRAAEASEPVQREPVHRQPQQSAPHRQRPAERQRTKPNASNPAPAGKSANPRRRPAKKKSNHSYLATFLFLWAAVAIPEFFLHIFTAPTAKTYFNSGFLLPLLFAVVPALILFAIFMLIPSRKVSYGITIAYSAVSFVLVASQLVYYKIFGTFYSAYSMSRGAQVLQFWKITLDAIFKNLHILILMSLPLIFVCVLGRRFLRFRKKSAWQMAVMPGVAAIVLQILLIVALPLFGGKQDMSAYDLYHNNSDSYVSVNKLGLMTAFRLDVTRQLTGSQPEGSMHLDNTPTPSKPSDATTPSGEVPSGSDPSASEPGTPSISQSGPNVLEFDFDKLINEADSDNLREVHQYFSSRTPSNKNAKTGIFKGCNLIMITGEAFSGLVIDEQRTPMLYKMYSEGYQLTDYYVPDWGTSTTDGEYSFLTGTVPKAGVWSFYVSALYGNSMPLTMVQQLKRQGYDAFAYHGHTFDYYNRNMYLENLGYKYRALDYGLDIDHTWPESDVQVVEQSYADYVNKEPFIAYYMSISGHREFNFTGNYISYQNKDLVKDEPYSENVRAYLACQIELEKSLQLLVEKLKEAGTYENTVFVITPDHYPNGLTHEEISELLGHAVEPNFELFKTKCIIYKPGMTPEVVSAPTSHLDLLPTLSNLFGLEFDSRLYMGRDVFSDAEPLVMFRNRSWITDKASYNASEDTFTDLTSEEMSDDYYRQIRNEVTNRFTVSSRILDYDYWRILFGEGNI